MKTLKYAAAAAITAVLWAGAAQATPYEGLAFNSQGPCLFGGVDCFRFSRFAQDFGDFGNSSSYKLADPSLANIGEAVYDVTGFSSIDNSGGMTGAQMDFSPGAAMDFEGNSLKIVGGTLNVGDTTPAWPPVTLPFGFGTAYPDYALTGTLEIEVNGVAMTFVVCEELDSGPSCDDDDDSRPVSVLQPYNTLNVGNDDNANNAGDGTTDLSMFLLLKSDGCTVDSGCEFAEAGGWSVNWIGEWYGWTDEKCAQYQNTHKCDYTAPDETVWLKIALWGEGEDGEVPEPATLSLFGLGLIGLGAAVRRRRKAA